MQRKNKFYEDISTRLREVTKNDSQVVVSNKLKCSQALISKYFKADLPEAFLLLLKLSENYPVDLHYLITGKRSPSMIELADRVKLLIKPVLMDIFSGLMDTQKKLAEFENCLDSRENKTDDNKTAILKERMKLLSINMESQRKKFDAFKGLLSLADTDFKDLTDLFKP